MQPQPKRPLFQEQPLIRNSQGFTLTEMLVVIALLAIIGTFVGTNIISKFNKAKVDSTKIQMRQLGTILDQFKLDCGFYPTEEQDLDALVEKPAGRDCINYDPEGYVKDGKIPKDSWDRDFLYFSDGRTYELRSLGNDGVEGGDSVDADISSKDL